MREVGIDGPDAAGKTIFAHRPAGRLPGPVIRASVDDFHNPPEVRFRLGRLHWAPLGGPVLWRMPVDAEPAARLSDVTVAEVAEALEAPSRLQARRRVDKDVIEVHSVTAEQRAVMVLLYRNDDSFVWRVAVAKPQTAAEFEIWLARALD